MSKKKTNTYGVSVRKHEEMYHLEHLGVEVKNKTDFRVTGWVGVHCYRMALDIDEFWDVVHTVMNIPSFCSLSYDRSVASSKASSP
jgi:hypothetical protein